MPVPLAGDPVPAVQVDEAAVAMVRLLITDLDETIQLFTDQQIMSFLTTEGGTVKLAAATALETIARSEALISKKITTQDLSTDGPAVAKELRESAKQLREQATAEADAADDFAMDVVDFDPAAAYRTGW